MAKEKVYRLEGLSCANCAAKFEKNIRQIDTVENAAVNFAAAKVSVQGDASIKQLEEAGAFDHIKVFTDHEEIVTKQSFWKKRENISALVSLLILVIGIVTQFALGMENPIVISIFILSIIIGGFDLFKTGLKNLFQFYFDMKTLMTIAIIGAVFIGEWMEGAIVVLLFALSEALESYSIDKARHSIQSLMNITPSKASIRRDGQIVELDVKQIKVDDVMVIKPGEKLAMDGEVISGQTSINQAAITGESIPIHKTVGDEVFAGTINEEGSIEVRVTKLVEDTTIAKIIHLVEEAQAEKAPAQHFVDTFAKYYTPAIMTIALFVAVTPPLLFAGDWSKWIYLGLATLVVGCPCALIISTPVAIVTAIGTAARHGVLIKGGVHLEETGRLRVIAFDKTGTITTGKPDVTEVISLSNVDTNEILKIATAIEAFSQHPIASAIIRETERRNITAYSAEKFHSITGKGAKAFVNEREYFIGNIALFSSVIEIPHTIVELSKKLQQKGNTVMLVGSHENVIGLIAVADQARAGSQSVMEQLKQLGIKKTIMLTGDNLFTAKTIARDTGITNVKADLLPEDKLVAMKELQEENGRVAMVGDGVNDAPALANATVGIAMGGAGTDAALETADIVLMEDDLNKLPFTISLSRRALQIIKQNISFSLGLKIIALLLVIPGWLTLWMAIIADVGATLIVVSNSMRLMSSSRQKQLMSQPLSK
ncbi:heavy metal translocating P-type ATPase [Pseudogracilibacillus auburnensis]|uniref:heavy metal translocating P-type ATPase n=1 Tax=Pseudogracilibacillus auburnensis TaxID=1494959 RepID=UPI001A97491F|nr:heavy metal translocating P-type ATPase [Pseudogracilibacillus auburnensis]MBO1002259.1 cadmium-translocating P-type ATPase [Pseudogracilibacillus auburnensis]